MAQGVFLPTFHDGCLLIVRISKLHPDIEQTAVTSFVGKSTFL